MTKPGMRRIGGRPVSGIGLGCASWSLDDQQPADRSLQTLEAALAAGVTLIDSARSYTTVDHPAHNENLIADGLARLGRSSDVLVATKGGSSRLGPTEFELDGRPAILLSHVDQSLRYLRREQLDLYLLHWPDPKVPIEESVGALASARDAGKIASVGVSNVSLELLERARSVTTIDAVENHFAPADRRHRALVDHCAANGIAFLAYSPLSGIRSDKSPQPSRLERLAREWGRSVAQLVLAWELSVSTSLIPLVGARQPSSIVNSAEVLRWQPSAAELRRISIEITTAFTEPPAMKEESQ